MYILEFFISTGSRFSSVLPTFLIPDFGFLCLLFQTILTFLNCLYRCALLALAQFAKDANPAHYFGRLGADDETL